MMHLLEDLDASQPKSGRREVRLDRTLGTRTHDPGSALHGPTTLEFPPVVPSEFVNPRETMMRTSCVSRWAGIADQVC